MEKEMYTVYITRHEKYYLPVNVKASSAEEALDKARRQDADNEFSDTWNELQPDVETDYDVSEADEPERGEGPLA